MQFTSFLNQISQNSSFFQKEAVTLLVCPENAPILFMSLLISFLKEKGIQLETIDVTDLELGSLFSRLETSFLGMNMSYLIRGLENKDKKVRQQVLAYLSDYRGPHTILLFCDKGDVSFFSANKNVVELPETVTTGMIAPLLALFKKNNAIFRKHIEIILSKQISLSLDQVCMLIGYLQVVGRADDYQHIIDRVVEQEHSLFTLAQHFFSKNRTEFYKLWFQVQDHYPLSFWTAYWGEQMWRAYYTHYYLEKGHAAQAKTISVRLPFSFMQRDWKKTTLSELKNAHQWIYGLDHAYKNNIEADVGLEVFYHKFFLNEF